MAWYEHILGAFAMLSCAGIALLVAVSIRKAREDVKADAAHIMELQMRIRHSE